MLCAGIVHGDLSEFNILVDAHGPVIIDLPQAVDAAANNNAPGIWNAMSIIWLPTWPFCARTADHPLWQRNLEAV